MNPDDYQDLLDHESSLGYPKLTALAVDTANGVVVAYSDLMLPGGSPELALKWGTLVIAEHRGHRLGAAVKVANLRELARVDLGPRSIRTSNAEQNPWMVQINVDLGFEIIKEILVLKKNVVTVDTC